LGCESVHPHLYCSLTHVKSLATGRIPYFVATKDISIDVEPPEQSFSDRLDGRVSLDCEFFRSAISRFLTQAFTVPSWKVQFCVNVLRPLMALMYSKSSTYKNTLAFESRITSQLLPRCAQGEAPDGSDFLAANYYFMARLYSEEGEMCLFPVRFQIMLTCGQL
jgi:hypothetical protein